MKSFHTPPTKQEQEDIHLAKQTNLTPCTIKMIQDMIKQNEFYLHMQGRRVDLVSIVGKILPPIKFGNSFKGNPQIILIVEDAISPGYVIPITMTQYDQKQDLMGKLLKRNQLSNVRELEQIYVKIILVVKQIPKSKFQYEAKSVDLLYDHNQLTHHMTSVMVSFCSRQYGELRHQIVEPPQLQEHKDKEIIQRQVMESNHQVNEPRQKSNNKREMEAESNLEQFMADLFDLL